MQHLWPVMHILKGMGIWQNVMVYKTYLFISRDNIKILHSIYSNICELRSQMFCEGVDRDRVETSRKYLLQFRQVFKIREALTQNNISLCVLISKVDHFKNSYNLTMLGTGYNKFHKFHYFYQMYLFHTSPYVSFTLSDLITYIY